MNDIYTMRTELANDFAVAGAKLLSFTATGGALAAIPETEPQQYAVAGTLESIQKVLPADEPSHPQRRLRRGDRPAEPLSFEDDAEPVIPAPRVEGDTLGAKLHDTMDAQVWATEFCRLNNASDLDMMRAWFANAIMAGWDFANRAHLARQAQPTDRDAVLEEAASVCDDSASSIYPDQMSKLIGTREDNAGYSAALTCAEAIRALKGKSGSEGAADEN